MLHFQWGTTMQVQEVNLSIYTSSFRIVRRFTFNPLNQVQFLAVGAHEFVWDGLDEEGRPLVPGTYLCFVGAKLGKKNYEASGDFSTP
jgi:flagellar hook assembly protein FlgD